MLDGSSNIDFPVLEARNITKRYGSTLALSNADLILSKGKIHALMGENGAGKSTMIKILVGASKQTSGELLLNGGKVEFNSVSSAISLGIVPVYQHLTLFPNLSVLENLYSFENAASGSGVAHEVPEARQRAMESLDRVGLDIDLDRLVETLSLSERQLLEIARAVHRDCKVLLLDEPTATLNQTETQRLISTVKNLAEQGVAVVYISHKTDEIRQVADEVTVLRDGKPVIKRVPLMDTSIDQIVDAMVGHAFAVSAKELAPTGDDVVQVDDLQIEEGAPKFSMMIKAGEIVGLAGLIGSGTQEIAAAIAGTRPYHSGHIRLHGKPVRANDRNGAVKMGIGYVPPDRHEEGLFDACTALNNASVSVPEQFSNYSIINTEKETQLFDPAFKELELSPHEPHRCVADFSGGNQQKILIARNLILPDLKLLVLIEPTRGVDVGARDKIHDSIVRMAHKGKAILIVTTDLEELTSLSHRILIIRDKRLVDELPSLSTPDHVSKAMLLEN